jgi:hypothetical protein
MNHFRNNNVTCNVCKLTKAEDYYTLKELTYKHSTCTPCSNEITQGANDFINETGNYHTGSTAYRVGYREAFDEYYFNEHGHKSLMCRDGEWDRHLTETEPLDTPEERQFTAALFASCLVILCGLAWFTGFITAGAN